MKKKTLRAQIEALREEAERERERALSARAEVRKLTYEVEEKRAHWAPIPIVHPWQPKNPQCALCDEPRDSPRHQVGTP